MRAFSKLGVRSVYDLRIEAERQAQPDRVPEGTEVIVCDVLADSADAAPAQLQKVIADPKGAEDILGGGKAVALFEKDSGERWCATASAGVVGGRTTGPGAHGGSESI